MELVIFVVQIVRTTPHYPNELPDHPQLTLLSV